MHGHELRRDRSVAGRGIVGRHPPQCGPQSCNSAAQGRMPDRSAKVGSLRERAHPGCDCDRCTPARSTARACAIPWIDGFAMELVVREPAPGEFRGVRAPDHDRPGTAQVGNRRAVLLGNQVSESGNAIRGRTAFLIGVDLGGDGNAEQRTGWAILCQIPICRVGKGQCLVSERLHDGIHPWIDRLQPRKTRRNSLPARHGACANCVRQSRRIPLPQLVCHANLPNLAMDSIRILVAAS